MVFGGLSISNGLAGDLKRGAHLDEALGGERPGHPVGEADNLSACHCEEAQAERGPTWQSHLEEIATPSLGPLGKARNDKSGDGPVP